MQDKSNASLTYTTVSQQCMVTFKSFCLEAVQSLARQMPIGNAVEETSGMLRAYTDFSKL